MAEIITQVCIALLGVIGAWINQSKAENIRRWGCLLGLLGQPFWLWTAWHAHQWGSLIASIGFTASFIHGVRVYWLPRSFNPF